MSDSDMWLAVGLSNRLKVVHEKMWRSLIEEGKHVTIYADGELLAEVNRDYTKDSDFMKKSASR